LVAIGDERRSRLRQAKLTALVRGHFGDEPSVTGAFPSGATLRRGDRAWILVEELNARSAGGPLLWASRQGAGSVDLVVDDATAPTGVVADVARRLDAFDLDTTCWRVQGTELVRIEPGPVPEVLDPPTDVDALVAHLRAAELEVVVEQGIVRGEVLGLEVARITPDDDSGYRLDVGVGKFDQVAAAMMYAHKTTADALDTVVDVVRAHRHPGAPPHPVRDLCRERWIRSAIRATPELVGTSELASVETTVPRDNLRDVHPAMAWAPGTVMACTHGVDIDLLPIAADVRRRIDPAAELVVVSATSMPPAVLGLARHLSGGVRFVEIEPPWDAPSGTEAAGSADSL
jgi:hypothetical protein